MKYSGEPIKLEKLTLDQLMSRNITTSTIN